jgi:hypothetical protein
MATFPTTPTIAQLTDVSATPNWGVGTVLSLSDGGEAIYAKALSELSQFAYCMLYGDGTAQMATTTLATTAGTSSTKRGGWCQQSIPSGYYGWIQMSGSPKGNLAANCDDQAPLYTTATAGVLDDATVSGGLIGGAISTVTISNATAVTLLVARGQMVVTGAVPA